MRKCQVALVTVGVALVLGGGSVAAEVPPEIAGPYLHIQVALADDSTSGVSEAAAAIADAAREIGEAGVTMAAAAQAVAAADDLVKTRAAFGPLSDAVIKYAKEAGLGDLKVAFCPMARKSWIQEDGAIANPFYGSEMLTCGSFR